MPAFKALSLLLGVLIVLGACGVFKKKRPPPCPPISFLKDARRLVSYAPGGGADLSAMLNEVRLMKITAACKYRKFEVEVDMEVTIAARRGPADRTRKAPARYFVAIMGPGGAVIAKQIFDVTLAFPVNIDAGSLTDSLVQKIPLDVGSDAVRHRIIVGLQLTPGQLKVNRDRAKIKLPGSLRDIPISPPAAARPPGERDFPPAQRGSVGRTPGESY